MEKKWYLSKLTWVGIILTLQGALPLLNDLVSKQAVAPSDVIAFVSGLLVVVLRVWFTDSAVEKSLL